MPNFSSIKPKKHEYTKDMIGEMYKCLKDPLRFIEKFVYIIHPEKGKMKIHLRDYQTRFIETMHNNRKTVVLASRQIGKCVNPLTSITYKMKDDDTKISSSIKDLFEKI